MPTGQPTLQPSALPSSKPSEMPTGQPTLQPSALPSSKPSEMPTGQPTLQPSGQPSSLPSQPSSEPTSCPSRFPSAVPSITPSRSPSEQPTSQPSCSLGNGASNKSPECNLCRSGTYRGQHDREKISTNPVVYVHKCILCGIGNFSDTAGSTECQICDSYPKSSPIEGQSSCDGIFLDMSGFSLYLFNALLIFLYICAIFAVKEERMKLFVISLFPTVDIVSDFNYVVTTRYYNVALFALSAISILLSVVLFLRKLIALPNPNEPNRIAYPSMIFNSYPGFKYIDNRLWWFEVEAEDDLPELNSGHHSHPGYPKGSDYFLRGMDTSHHDSIGKVLVFGLCWIIMILLQILYLISFMLWLLLAPLFCWLWFLVGVWVYQNKTLATKYVWNGWFQVWTGTNDFDTDVDIDVGVLNESVMLEFALESLPQMCLQFANNTLIGGKWSAVGVFSMIFSAFMAINGCYRYFYWVVCMGTPLDQLPVEVSLLGLFAIHIEPRRPAVDDNEVHIEMTEKDDKVGGGYAVVASDVKVDL